MSGFYILSDIDEWSTLGRQQALFGKKGFCNPEYFPAKPLYCAIWPRKYCAVKWRRIFAFFVQLSITDAVKCSPSSVNHAMHPKQAIHRENALVVASNFLFALAWSHIYELMSTFITNKYFSLQSAAGFVNRKSSLTAWLGFDLCKALHNGRGIDSLDRDKIQCIHDCVNFLICSPTSVHQNDCVTISKVSSYPRISWYPQCAWAAMRSLRSTVSPSIQICWTFLNTPLSSLFIPVGPWSFLFSLITSPKAILSTSAN